MLQLAESADTKPVCLCKHYFYANNMSIAAAVAIVFKLFAAANVYAHILAY